MVGKEEGRGQPSPGRGVAGSKRLGVGHSEEEWPQ